MQGKLTSWKQLVKHQKENSKCNRKNRYLDIGDLISQTICHICKICSVRIICDSLFLKRHMLSKHQLKYKEYIKKFGLDCSKVARKEDTYSDNIIGNLCVYTCQECLEEFSSWRKLCRHQQNLNHIRTSLKDRCKVRKSTYHKCRLCYRSFLCEKYYLQKHIASFHGLSMNQYCTKTGCKMQEDKGSLKLKTLKLSDQIENFCIFACQVCRKTFHGVSSLNSHRHRENHHSKSRQPIISNLVNGFSYKCKLCPSLMLCDRSVIQKHMTTIHQVTLCMKKFSEKQVQYTTQCGDFINDFPVSANVPEKTTVQVELTQHHGRKSHIGKLCT